jgi:hypothetical protein
MSCPLARQPRRCGEVQFNRAGTQICRLRILRVERAGMHPLGSGRGDVWIPSDGRLRDGAVDAVAGPVVIDLSKLLECLLPGQPCD